MDFARSIPPRRPFLATLACLAAVAADPAGAQQDHDYCYAGDPPPGVTVTGKKGAGTPVAGLPFAAVPTLYRRVCGVDDETDAAYMRGIYGQAGCAPTSDVGREFERMLTADVRGFADYPYFAYMQAIEPAVFSEACALFGRLVLPLPGMTDETWDRQGFTATFEAAKRLMESGRERFRSRQ